MTRSLITSVSLFLFFILTTAMSCDKKSSNVDLTWIIASAQADCQGVTAQKCLLTKVNISDEWEYYYDQIEGFEYQEGYEYVIKVRQEAIENPPADASSLKHTFLEEISKEMKVSEGLPE